MSPSDPKVCCSVLIVRIAQVRDYWGKPYRASAQLPYETRLVVVNRATALKVLDARCELSGEHIEAN
jgi:hypothetical protein